MITMITKSRLKVAKKYSCEKCVYSCRSKYDWTKHLSTTKHKMITNDNKKSPKVASFSCVCGNVYKFRSGLSRHKKKCMGQKHNNVVEVLESSESMKVAELYQTMKELVEDNRRKTELMEKILAMNSELIPKVGNNNNNKISINVFLNEKCKDAMNLQDFLEQVTISLEDLTYTKNNGYVKGISNIFVKHLTDLEPTERPIHCSDKKRLQFYVKEENKWKRDDKKINQSIQNVTVKQIKQLKEWENLHPNYLSDERLTEEWHQMIHKIMGGSTDEEREKNTESIKKEISTTVDMKNAMIVKKRIDSLK